MSLKSIISGIGHTISQFLSWMKLSTKAGLEIANQVKNAVDGPFADLIVNLTPTNLDNMALTAFRAWLPTLFKDLGLIQTITDTLEENVAHASATIAQMELPVSKAGTLNTVAAAINHKIAELNGNDMPINVALSVAQVAYNQPELLD